jgi:hypothetical protein
MEDPSSHSFFGVPGYHVGLSINGLLGKIKPESPMIFMGKSMVSG